MYVTGIDIGSVASKIVILDEEKGIIYFKKIVARDSQAVFLLVILYGLHVSKMVLLVLLGLFILLTMLGSSLRTRHLVLR